MSTDHTPAPRTTTTIRANTDLLRLAKFLLAQDARTLNDLCVQALEQYVETRSDGVDIAAMREAILARQRTQGPKKRTQG